MFVIFVVVAAAVDSQLSQDCIILLCRQSDVHCPHYASLCPRRRTSSRAIFAVFAPWWMAASTAAFLLHQSQSTTQSHPPPPLCPSRCHLAHHPPTVAVLFLFAIFVAASPTPAYGWLLCVGQMGSDIVDVVLPLPLDCPVAVIAITPIVC